MSEHGDVETAVVTDTTDPFEQLAQRAGAALQHAPSDTQLAGVMVAGRRRQRARVVAAGSVVALVTALVLAAAFAGGGDHSDKPADTTAPPSVPLQVPGTLTPRLALGGRQGLADAVEYSADGSMVVAVELEHAAVRRWDARTGVGRTLDLSPSPNSFVVDTSRLSVAVARSRGVTVVYSADGSRKASFSGGTPLAFSPDGQVLISSTGAWDVASGRQRWASAGRIQTAAFRLGGTEVAVSTADAVELRSASTGKTILPLGGEGAQSLTFSADGSRLATLTSSSGSGPTWTHLRVWDVSTGIEVPTPWSSGGRDTSRRVTLAALSGDGRRLAIASRFSPGAIYDFGTGRVINIGDSSVDREIYALAFSPDGRLLATRSDLTLRLYDPSTGVVRWTASNSSPNSFGYSESVDFSPEGRELVTSNGADPEIFDVPAG
jgi:WD40 repeat protein